MAGIHVVDHPLVQHKISLMRDKMTGDPGSADEGSHHRDTPGHR